MTTRQFDFLKELETTVTHSLATSFGLDFLLFEDKKGGDVDTIHNVRQSIYATEQEKLAYQNRESYNSHDYHSHKDYIAHGKADKKLQQSGALYDNYLAKTMRRDENRQLDHTISASEIHHDAGRILAEQSGVNLANSESNLNSTYGYVNNLKRDHSVEKFVNEIAPAKLNSLQNEIAKDKAKLATMPTDTPKQRDEKHQMESKLQKDIEKAEALETILKNKDSMLAADKKARIAYETEINKYYSSSKFLKNTALTSLNSGLKMGMRQTLGLVLAEIWFELKEQIPEILLKHKYSFDFGEFLFDVKTTLKNIWERVKSRFNDILTTFKEGGIAGILSSITNTVFNIFSTTTKIVGKVIREMWTSLVKVAKLVFFNPDKLTAGRLTKEVFKVLGTGISVVIASIINVELNTILGTIPFGTEISAFLSALVAGLCTLGIGYFLEYSELMQKVWAGLDQFFKNKYDLLLEEFQRISAALDEHLAILAKVELGLNPTEIRAFTDSLTTTNDRYARSQLIKQEIEKRNIELPFEAGNSDRMMEWVLALRKK
ncbi:ATPase [Basfia succiniciproducens]|uniref:ATPase n=1 Tax=Basfia succiniciproducens TaxID=653940 RepID=UPI0008C39BFA|nr:ATPase [Basfia succiniciproducens]SEP84109.1 hypothetical protein SAMN02910415_00529 [Basfia succiniciproducens]